MKSLLRKRASAARPNWRPERSTRSWPPETVSPRRTTAMSDPVGRPLALNGRAVSEASHPHLLGLRFFARYPNGGRATDLEPGIDFEPLLRPAAANWRAVVEPPAAFTLNG